MDLLYNNDTINEIVDKLFKSRKSEYSEQNLDNLLATKDFENKIIKVPNKYYEILYGSIFTKKQVVKKPKTCIVFMHGYGSNRLESLNILRQLDEGYSLTCFDFSGSGKSQGDHITYGMKEKDDIHCILNHLRSLGFNRFILWGRSMGATSSLLYCLTYKPIDVLLQIIDSPFYSFKMIAFEIANKSVKAPEFIISFALEMARKNCQKFENNPFEIELKNVSQCRVPALFLYSQQDTVINCCNTELILQRYRATFEKLIISQNHNSVRLPATVRKVFHFIDKYCKKQKANETILRKSFMSTGNLHRSILPCNQSDCSTFGSHVQNLERNKSVKKGIERVRLQEEPKKFDDYGIWVSSKFKRELCPTISRPIIPSNPKNINRKTNLSLSVTQSQNLMRHSQQMQPNYQWQMQSPRKTHQIYQGGDQLRQNRSSYKLSAFRSMAGSRCLDHTKYL